MARRRRSSSKKRTSRRSNFSIEVHETILREIWAVVYLALGVSAFLSLSGVFGVIGMFWMNLLKPILGWGIFVLPYFFLFISLTLFFAKKVTFPLSRILGIVFLVTASLSILHLYVPMSELYSTAQQGRNGGYIGFVMNFIFREILNIGDLGAVTVFLTTFLIGVLLTFEISLAALIRFFKPEIKLVKKKTRSVVPRENEVDEEEDVEEFEDDEFSEEDVEQERFRVQQDQQPVEMIKIRRASDERVEEPEREREIAIKQEEIDGPADDYVWIPPSLDLLVPAAPDVALDDKFLQVNAKKIHDKLRQFGLDVEMHEAQVGPTVIQYTLRPDEGVKLSKITSLKNDLALALAAKAIRIEAPIPGKDLVGIEVPNDKRSLVHLRELLESKDFRDVSSNLRLPLGRDVAGKPICGDLAAMPHLLVAGATGSGKSVGMNTFLTSLLYQNSPYDLKMILIDPKRVEMSNYNGIPHLLTPVITEPEKAALALRWAVAEMNRRYKLCAELRHRTLAEYNQCTEQHDQANPDQVGHTKMPNIVIVIDELADLMMAAGKEVEASICRIAQMARAMGMHLIVATQRPSVDVITGLIKANIPTRIAFAVSSSIDSRTILDTIGAEDLLGKGDMLYLDGGMSRPMRIQGIYISPKEIERVTNQVKIAGPPNYDEDIISPKIAQERISGLPESDLSDDADDDALYQRALQIVVESRKASASLLQRRMKLGYARAARLLDQMEENGVIGPVNGAKAREIYIE